VEGAFGISQAQLESMDITIKVSNIDRGMIVECRKNEVIQALHNVILNARDAVLVANHKWIQVDCEVQEGQLLMAVTDSGLLQKNISDRIMEPFFTTKEVGRGRGMGLSVTLGLIKGHGGRFYYDSSSPNTRFVIEVPLTQASAQAA
jgi:C4-dicarboxylate-specific signal transduction histidine kinase